MIWRLIWRNVSSRLIRQAGGYYENFDAKTGKGLKTKAYTWTFFRTFAPVARVWS